jgi:hypothetical protein
MSPSRIKAPMAQGIRGMYLCQASLGRPRGGTRRAYSSNDSIAW